MENILAVIGLKKKKILHIYAAFGYHIASKTLPSYQEIQKLKDDNPGIFNRNSATIKTWVNNQIKKQK